MNCQNVTNWNFGWYCWWKNPAPPGWLKPYKYWDNHHPWWCRILSINSIIPRCSPKKVLLKSHVSPSLTGLSRSSFLPHKPRRELQHSKKWSTCDVWHETLGSILGIVYQPVILLMVQRSGDMTGGYVWNPPKKWEMLYINCCSLDVWTINLSIFPPEASRKVIWQWHMSHVHFHHEYSIYTFNFLLVYRKVYHMIQFQA